MFSRKYFIIILLSILPGFCLPTESTAQLDLSPPPNMAWNTATQDTIVIPLILTNPDSVEVDAYTLRVNYSGYLLKFIATDSAATLTENWIFSQGQEDTSGRVIVGGFAVTPTRDSGTLINLKFVLTGQTGTGSINLSNFDDDIAPATADSGDIMVNGNSTSVESSPEVPQEITLQQNYPNPFNPETTITYTLPHHAHVKLTLYNTNGEQVIILVNGEMRTGQHTTLWDGLNALHQPVASGTYFYTLEAGNLRLTKKLTLIR